MATQGPNSPGTASSDQLTLGQPWTNLNNIKVSDGVYASADGNNNPSPFYHIIASNYGFTLPSDAVVNGIAVTIQRQGNGDGGGSDIIVDREVRIVKSTGVLGTTNKADTTTHWPQSPTPESSANYGGVADLWGETWAFSDINSSNFGVALSVNDTVSNDFNSANVDYISITVTYTSSGATTTSTSVSTTSQSTSTSLSTSTSQSTTSSSTSQSTSISTTSQSTSQSTSTSHSTTSTSISQSTSTSISTTSQSTSHSTSTSASTTSQSMSTSLSTSVSTTSQSTSHSTSISTSTTSQSTSTSLSTSSTSQSTSTTFSFTTSTSSTSISSTSSSTSTTTVIFSDDIPIGFIAQQPLINKPVTSDSTLVDDPIALVNDSVVLSGGPAAISEGIRANVGTTVPLPRIKIGR